MIWQRLVEDAVFLCVNVAIARMKNADIAMNTKFDHLKWKG
ncbi:hypothetical protein LCGC14_2620830 [marine sediment metagenome]|uniref:Uncharacterized protein n=1 Tax=marine sediment metagenome TaxID=412755 RepID=A0A0F9A398_9ZZZZ